MNPLPYNYIEPEIFWESADLTYLKDPTPLYELRWDCAGQHLAETAMPMEEIQALARSWVSKVLKDLQERITRDRLRKVAKQQFMSVFVSAPTER